MEKVELEKMPIGKRVWNYFNFKKWDEEKSFKSSRSHRVHIRWIKMLCVCQWMWFWMEQMMGKKELESVKVKGDEFDLF